MRIKRNIDLIVEWIIAVILTMVPYVFTIINGTNLGKRLYSYQIWLTILILITFYLLIIKQPLIFFGKQKNMVLIYCLMVFIFVISTMQNFTLTYGLLLGLMLSTVFSFAYIGQKRSALLFTGYAYAALTLFILYDFTNGGLTKSWNTNSIGLLATYGVFWMFVTRSVNERKRRFLDWFIIYGLILSLLVTDSRTALMGVTIYILFRFFVLKKLIFKKWFFRIYYLFVFLLPIGIVNLYISIWKSELAPKLDYISYNYTEKLFFSGREMIWDYLYRNLSGYWLLGFGKELQGNAHSLYMNVLYSVGILGLIFYLLFLISVYEYLFNYCRDEIVRGCILAFSSIYLMQTFETVMFNTMTLNILPYLILAAALGRSKFLHNQEKTLR